MTCIYYVIVHTHHIHGSDMCILCVKCIDMYIQFWIYINMHVHGIDMYIHLMYKYVFTSFRRVCTCLYKYIRVLTYKNMYIPCTYMHIHVCYLFLVYIHVCQGMYSWCSVNRWLHTFHEMYRHCWMVYVHWCILLGSAFWFALLAGPACRLGLAAAWSLFKFKH